MCKNKYYLLGGLATGLILGAGAALLLAPQDGETTRRDIKDRLRHLEDEIAKSKEKIAQKGKKVKKGVQNDISSKIEELEAKINALKEESTN